MKQSLRILLFVTFIVILTACGTAPKQQTTQTTPKPTENSAATTVETPAETTVAQPEKTKAKVTVFYTNDDLTNLVEESQEISYQDDQEKYEQVMALLGKPAMKGHQALWSDFAYHSIKLKDGKLTIDASSKNQYNLGSTGELFALDSLTKSFFQFPEIKEIVFLEDGKPTESLMGHMDVSKPLTRDSSK